MVVATVSDVTERMIHLAWCSEIGSLTSLDACNSGASSDRREPISLHQAVQVESKYKEMRHATF